MAWYRRVFVTVSLSAAAPSMSKSSFDTPNLLMTELYEATSEVAFVHDFASSLPCCPPNDTTATAPEAWPFLTSLLRASVPVIVVPSSQVGVQHGRARTPR